MARPAVDSAPGPSRTLAGDVLIAAGMAGLAADAWSQHGRSNRRAVAADAAIGPVVDFQAFQGMCMPALLPGRIGCRMARHARLGWVLAGLDGAGQDIPEAQGYGGVIGQAVVDGHGAPGLDRSGGIDQQQFYRHAVGQHRADDPAVLDSNCNRRNDGDDARLGEEWQGVWADADGGVANVPAVFNEGRGDTDQFAVDVAAQHPGDRRRGLQFGCERR